MAASLIQHIIHGSLTGVRKGLAQGLSVNTLDPVMGNSPLHFAVQGENIAIAQELINAGAFINLQTPQHGVTPLMVAVWHRQPEMVKLLLSLDDINPEIRSYFGLIAMQLIGFGSEATDAFSQKQQQAIRGLFDSYYKNKASSLAKMSALKLMVSTTLNDEQLARELIALPPQGLNVNSRWPVDSSGNDGHTALLIAAREGLPETTQALLKLGADQTLSDHYMRAVPLHKAAYQGHASIIRLLAKARGFDEIKDLQGPNNGYTPLHDAVWHGHYDATHALIEAGVNMDIQGYDGRTALDLAHACQYERIAVLILNTKH